jgi:hypothetical protein
MTQEEQIREIEVSVEELKKAVDLKNSVEKLYNNRDFKKVFLNVYFKEEPARLTGLLADDNMIAHRNLIIEDMLSISGVQDFLRNIVRAGQAAEQKIKEADQLQERIYEEGALDDEE